MRHALTITSLVLSASATLGSVGAPAVCPDASTVASKASCPTDLNGDGWTNGGDARILMANWGPCHASFAGDFNGDRFVDGADLGYLIANWGSCKG